MNNLAELISAADPAVTPNSAEPDARALIDLAAILEQPRPELTAAPARGRAYRPVTIVVGAIAACALVLGGIILIQGVQTPPASMGDWPWYESDAALVERADLVVSGTVGDIRNETDQGVTYRVAPFTVEGVAKGDVAPGAIIEVKFMGENSPSHASLRSGQRYVLLLETYPDSPASLLNPEQGAYDISADGAVSPRQSNTVLLSDDLLARLDLHR